MVSSAMIGAAANQEASTQKPLWKFSPLIPIPENYPSIGLMNLDSRASLIILGRLHVCHGELLFFSLPLLMATEMSFTKATRHLDILGRMIVPWRNNLWCELPGYNRDPWSQISSGLEDESSFWSLTWYNGMVFFEAFQLIVSSFRWAISSNKFSRTTWRN